MRISPLRLTALVLLAVVACGENAARTDADKGESVEMSAEGAPVDGMARDSAAEDLSRAIGSGQGGPGSRTPGRAAVGDAFGGSGGASRGRPGSAAESAPVAALAPPDAMAVGYQQKISGSGSEGTIVPSMLIKTGHVMMEVDSIEIAIVELQRLAQRAGGFVANMSSQGGEEQMRSASLEIRMPSARFDETMTSLGTIGEIESRNVTSEDVGEEYVDIEARMKNARRLEDRLIELLANRTGRLSDVLSVERELARVREEIERSEGRMRYLRTRAAVSTIQVNMRERRPLLGSQPGSNPIARAFQRAWRNFVDFVANLIAMLGVLIPLALIIAGAWLVIRRFLPLRKGPADKENPPRE